MALHHKVARGARWLDRRTPGWERSVNAHRLAETTDGCVLGQVYGDFHTSMMEIAHLPKKFDDMLDDHGILPFVLFPWALPTLYSYIRFLGFDSGPQNTTSAWRAAWADEINVRLARKHPATTTPTTTREKEIAWR